MENEPRKDAKSDESEKPLRPAFSFDPPGAGWDEGEWQVDPIEDSEEEVND